MDKIFTPVINKVIFWAITVVINVFVFLGYSYLQNTWASPQFVEQKIISVTDELRDSENDIRNRISSLESNIRARDENVSKNINQILLGMNELQVTVRHINEGVKDLKVDNSDIKNRILQIERRGN